MAAEAIKFDANAGVAILPEARDAMIAILGDVANASAIHSEGRAARSTIDRARENVAALVGASADHVVFTSGATEAACTVLTPHYLFGKQEIPIGRLYVGATEHPCVLSGGRFAADKVTKIPVHSSGELDLLALADLLDGHDHEIGRPLVAVMLANNETGVLHPVADMVEIARRNNAIIFCDAVQAIGRVPVDIGALDVDFLAISGHKMGGPQGIGALVFKDESLMPRPLLSGGGQERYRRAGTENVAAIAGFAVASELAEQHMKSHDELARLRDRLQNGIARITPDARFFGTEAERLPNTLLFAVPGVPAETAVIALDLEGIAVSSGSACSSGKVAASHVLVAMGAETELANSGIRISLPNSAKEKDTDRFLSVWADLADRLIKREAA